MAAESVGLKPDLRSGFPEAVDSALSGCISRPVPEEIPGLFIGVGGFRKE
jgi:hypothetical protein